MSPSPPGTPGLPMRHVAPAHPAATVAVALVPVRGGLGSAEAVLAVALAVALIAAGGPAAVSAAVVLPYRIIALRLPSLPGR